MLASHNENIDNLIGLTILKSVNSPAIFESKILEMYKYNERIDNNNNNNQSKIDKKFLDELSKFIQSAESEMDILGNKTSTQV